MGLRVKVLKRVRAARLGIWFFSQKRLRLPQRIRIEGRRQRVSFPAGDWAVPGIFSEVVLEDVYGLRARRGCYRTILDVGANVGAFSLAARIANPDAIIHAYEPNPALEPYLAVNCEAARATFFVEALAGRPGRRGLALEMNSSGYTRTVPGDEIPAVTIATAVGRLGGSIDLAKLDCEGSEWELLQDPAPWARIHAVVMEYHFTDGQTRTDAVDALIQLGYRIERHQHVDHESGILIANR